MENKSLLISAEELVKCLDKVQVLDCSGGSNEKYLEKHIPTAVFLEMDKFRDLDNPLPNMLPTKDQMQSHMTQLKVGMSKPIVCYDTESNSQAARACFNLQSWGFTDVQVLDGGLKAWGDNPTESK